MENILRIDNVHSRLASEDMSLKRELWKSLRFREKNYYHSPAYRQKKWDGFKDFFTLKAGQFLTGLLPEVKFALNKWQIPYQIVDNRTKTNFLIDHIDETFLWCRNHTYPTVLRDYQIDLTNKALKARRGVIEAKTGCHRIGQQILMHDGRLKSIEDINVGDVVMGPKGKPRHVLNLCRGYGQMYEIKPTRGKPFVVNEDHILTLQRTNVGTKDNPNTSWGVKHNGETIDVSVKDWLVWKQSKKHQYKLFKSEVNFTRKEKLPIKPYFLGVLLGDGTMKNVVGITTHDFEIKDYIYSEAANRNVNISVEKEITSSSTYYFRNNKKHNSKLIGQLKGLSLFGTNSDSKFIPHIYKTSSKKNRLELLAGLLDTDGSLDSKHTGYDFISKSSILANDIVYLARSLGLKTSDSKKCIKSDQNGTKGVYYRVYIACKNDCYIPCKITRKKATKKKSLYHSTRTGFTVSKLGFENYYGFTLDQDGRYLLDDFTVTHNSGKTNILISLIKALPPKTPTIVLVDQKELVYQNYEEIKKFGIEDVGMFFSDEKTPNYITVALINSIPKLEALYPKYKALFVDEIHAMTSKRCIEFYKKCPNADIRIGFSATPFKFDGKDSVQKFMVKGHIGGILKTDHGQDGKLTTGVLQERKILSVAHCTFYDINEPQRPYDIYQDAFTYGVAQNEYLNQGVTRLVKNLKGRTLIVVDRIEHGERLLQLIPDAFWLHGTKSKDYRKSTINELKFNKGDFVAVAIDKIVNKGLNVFIHNLINCAGGKAAHNVLQRIGRGLRPAGDKTDLLYYDFYFKNNPYLENHSEERIKIIESEGHTVTLKEKFDY